MISRGGGTSGIAHSSRALPIARNESKRRDAMIFCRTKPTDEATMISTSVKKLSLRGQQFTYALVEPSMRFVLHPMSDAGHELERGVRAKLPEAIAAFVKMR